MTAAVCAILKNEGRYLREFISHHVALGFRHLYLFDNESTDETGDILKQAAEYGIVTTQRIESRPDQIMQLIAYEIGLKLCQEDYIIFIDGDELLNLKIHDNIDHFLNEHTSDAIGINWRIFGDGGATHYEPGLMSDRFRLAAFESFEPNYLVKTIARTSAIRVPWIHTHYLVEGATFTNTAGQPLKQAPEGFQEFANFDIAQVNHYFSKTFEEWELKRNRGRAGVAPNDPSHVRPDSHWHAHNRNDVADDSISRWSSKTKRIMKSIFEV